MSTQQTLITSRDDKGRHAVNLFATQYDKEKLDGEQAQRLNERGGELQDGISKLIAELSVSDRYASEEVTSSYTYPGEYNRRPIEEQVESIAKMLDLDPQCAYEFAKNLPELPNGAEGWFAIPSVKAVAKKHFPEVTDQAEQDCRACQLVHSMVADQRKFRNWREGEITSDRLRVHARSAHAMDLIAEQQTGDILIIAAQLGMRHRGRSVRRAREVFVADEFGLGSFAVGCIVLTHPERLVRYEELDMDCAGDEFSLGADGSFSRAPFWHFDDGEVGFDMRRVDDASDYYGSASGFVPQS